jgi:PAS domain-containing protein
MVDRDIRFIFVDHMWEIMMGYRREEVVGHKAKEVVGCSQCRMCAPAVRVCRFLRLGALGAWQRSS